MPAGHDEYKSKLDSINNSWIILLMPLYEQLRIDGLEIIDRDGGKQEIIDLYAGFRAKAEAIAAQKAKEIQSAARAFVIAQYEALGGQGDVSEVEFPDIGAEWVGVLLAKVLAQMSPFESHDGIFAHKNSTWSKGKTSMKSAISLEVYGFGNYILSAFYGQLVIGHIVQRQAIAVIDSSTTDCCLRVHGQVVGLNEPFRLTGTPRFADSKMSPPFHWNCRTIVCLRGTDERTEAMLMDANAEITARQEKK